MGRSIRCKSLEWLGICYVELYDEGSVQILQGFWGFALGGVFFCGLDGYQSERLISCTRSQSGFNRRPKLISQSESPDQHGTPAMRASVTHSPPGSVSPDQGWS
jgi:hypothetical protein